MVKVDRGFKCYKCDLVTTTKYSMKRHIDRKHGQKDAVNEITNETNAIENELIHPILTKVTDELDEVLENAGLGRFRHLFDKENIDISMLLDLDTDEFMNMAKELGISSWGERRNLKKAVQDHKWKIENQVEANQGNSEENSVENHDATTFDNDKTQVENVCEGLEIKECELCKSSTQHKCRVCKKQVCNLFCSIQDPNSDNESHRIHKNGDQRCKTDEVFSCSECSTRYKTQDELKSHQ